MRMAGAPRASRKRRAMSRPRSEAGSRDEPHDPSAAAYALHAAVDRAERAEAKVARVLRTMSDAGDNDDELTTDDILRALADPEPQS